MNTTITSFLKKHKRVLIWSTSIFAFLILCLLAYLRISATLHFTLQTELLATHTPAQLLVTTTNNATTTVSVRTTIETFHACESVCSYAVDGLYELTNATAKNLVHTFTVNTPEYGFGQKLAYFKSSCQTVPSTFCPSTQKIINQTSLIVIDYTLRPNEQQIVDALSAITPVLLNATRIVEQLRFAKQLSDLWPAQTVKILDDKQLSTQLTAITQAWKRNEFDRAHEIFGTLNESVASFSDTATPTLLAQITQYNQLQTTIATVLENQSIREYLGYAQTYDETAGTARQAVMRLTTILAQTYIDDMARAQAVATGAIQYLENKTQIYVAQKNETQQVITFARTVLPLIKTPLLTLPMDMCNATQELRAHNDWASASNYTILTDVQMQTTVQPVNATYLFTIPEAFCVARTPIVQISLEHAYVAKQIKLPTLITLAAPQLATPTPLCYLGTQRITCSANATKPTSPILFIHGHSFDESNSPQISMTAFSHLQEQLEQNGYINAGELLEQTSGTILAPFTMRASYYYIKQYGVGSYSFDIQKSERIENYAIRLKEIIDSLKEISGSPNVTIIAHSMGGLVVREYTNLFGMDAIDRVITINTPHQGISGRTVSVCDIIGAAKECEDMTVNSTFLRRLPAVTGTWDVIASTGCQMKEGLGDGVVLLQNSVLSGATYHLINGTCTDALQSDLHTTILEDKRLYELIVSILRK